MRAITAEVNRTLRGWFEYFKHGVNNVCEKQDKWVRQRLRAALRKRHQGSGRPKGNDYQRWPNASFAGLGLISLALAHSEAIQSGKRTHRLESRMP
jgi:RNA-directed DNA polymerase